MRATDRIATRVTLALALACLAVACDQPGPTAPGHDGVIGAPLPAGSTGPFVTRGRLVDTVNQSGFANITVQGDGLLGYSDPTGAFALLAPTSKPDPRDMTFTGSGIVQRQTHLRVPGPDAAVSLIASTFDLTAFNQMMRVPQLQRWVTAPPLLVETRALQFTDVNASSAVGVADAMSDAEYGGMVDDLTWALPQLTGATFGGFAGVTRQNSADGATVTLLASGRITVARVVGLTASTGFWGYGRWLTQGDGTVVGGNLVLDRDFERSGSQFSRSLRAHELGHAMGYNHVTSRASFMNSSARLEPNVFDLAACQIAFARRPGNLSPDTDPSSASLNSLSQILTWGPAIR